MRNYLFNLWSTIKIFVVGALSLYLSGCIPVGHQVTYQQVAPVQYPATSDVKIFNYVDVEITDLYKLLFSDFLIIGQTAFIAAYQDPVGSASYAKSIGADIFITTAELSETKTSYVNLEIPKTTTGYIDGGGAVTIYDTETTTVPISVNHYKQRGMYLRNVNGVTPLWERMKSQYDETEENELTGNWVSTNYDLELFQSGGQMVAFIKNPTEYWAKGRLKLVFNVESRMGFYLMGDSTPRPARFSLNKFGHLKVELLGTHPAEFFSFAKKL